MYFKIRKLHFTYIARTSLTVTIGCEVQLSTDVRSNENKWRGSSSYEVRPPPRPSTNNSDAMNDLSVELSNKLNVKQNILILYCDKLWLQYTFYSYILYSSLDQKLLLFTLSIQWAEIDKCVLIPSAVIRFEFLRFYRGTSRLDPSTIKKCPHMLRSDHTEMRNS